MYLNLVLDYVPETVYRVARHFNKAKTTIPIIYVKVSPSMALGFSNILHHFKSVSALQYMHTKCPIYHPLLIFKGETQEKNVSRDFGITRIGHAVLKKVVLVSKVFKIIKSSSVALNSRYSVGEWRVRYFPVSHVPPKDPTMPKRLFIVESGSSVMNDPSLHDCKDKNK